MFYNLTKKTIYMSVSAGLLFNTSIYADDADFGTSFVDVSEKIDFIHSAVENGGEGFGGASWFDYDQDGDMDIYLSNGKFKENGLFRNNGDSTFTNVSVAAGVTSGEGNSGVVTGDLNNDGYPEIITTGEGGVFHTILGGDHSANVVYLNNGDGTFADISVSSNIIGPDTAASISLGDVNNDGFLDVFIGAHGDFFGPVQISNKLFLNNGDLTFTDITVSAGLTFSEGACTNAMSDYDNDGDLDIFVANCNRTDRVEPPVHLFRNNGDLTFTNVSGEAGFLGYLGGWMGISISDYDADGDFDMFVTNTGLFATPTFGIGPHALFENQGDGTFENVSQTAGVSDGGFGWSTSFEDFDNNGHPDIFYAGSLFLPHLDMNIVGPKAAKGNLMMSEISKDHPEKTFVDMSTNLGGVIFSDTYNTGSANGDFNNDGFFDLILQTEPVRDANGNVLKDGHVILLENQGNNNNWVGIKLVGTISNRDAVGAKVKLTADAGSQWQEAVAGTGYLSDDDKRMVFGLGSDDKVKKVKVKWPSGCNEKFEIDDINQYVTLVEGDGKKQSSKCPN